MFCLFVCVYPWSTTEEEEEEQQRQRLIRQTPLTRRQRLTASSPLRLTSCSLTLQGEEEEEDKEEQEEVTCNRRGGRRKFEKNAGETETEKNIMQQKTATCRKKTCVCMGVCVRAFPYGGPEPPISCPVR